MRSIRDIIVCGVPYDPAQHALTIRSFGGTLRTATFWIFLLNRGAAIKTLLVVAVIVALHCPVSLTTRVSVAGTVNELGDPADPHGGVTARRPLSGIDEVDATPALTDAVPARSKKSGPERRRDAPADVAFTINGVVFTFDSLVARSFWLDLFTNAGAEEDDLPSSGGGKNLSLPTHRVIKVNAHFNEHVKSISDSKFLSPNSPQLNEWDSLDFRPPEWVMKVREVVRDAAPFQPESSTSHPGSHPGEVDAMTWLRQFVHFFVSIQRQIEEIEPMTLALIGIFILPFALVVIVLKIRKDAAPSRGRQRQARTTETSRPPTRVRVRRRRKRTQSLRVKSEMQN